MEDMKEMLEVKITQLTLIKDLDEYKELCNESTILMQKKNEDAVIAIENKMLKTIDLIEKCSNGLFKKEINDTMGAIFNNQKLRREYNI